MTSKVDPDWKAMMKTGDLTDAQIQRQVGEAFVPGVIEIELIISFLI